MNERAVWWAETENDRSVAIHQVACQLHARLALRPDEDDEPSTILRRSDLFGCSLLCHVGLLHSLTVGCDTDDG